MRARLAAAAVGISVLAGCARGLLYTQTTQPLTTNFHDTPSGIGTRTRGEGDIKRLRYYIEVWWDSNAIGEIAKANGIETIYYADIETLSVLGVWRQTFVNVYGK